MSAEAALAGSLSVFARAGKPHGVVSHVFVRGFLTSSVIDCDQVDKRAR